MSVPGALAENVLDGVHTKVTKCDVKLVSTSMFEMAEDKVRRELDIEQIR